jgi:hypothetical protein
MACLAIPKPPVPTLPFPFTLTPPPVPAFKFNPKWCCKLPTFATPPVPPIPGVALNPAVVAGLLAGLKAVGDYLDKIPLRCPREA